MPQDRPGRTRGSRHRRHVHSSGLPHDDRSTIETEALVLDLPETAWERFARITSLHEAQTLARSPGGRLLVGAIAAIAVATLIGLAALWPGGDDRAAAPGTATVAATITQVTDAACPGTDAFGDPTQTDPAGAAGATPQRCRTLTVDPEGELPPGSIAIGPTDGAISVDEGDAVRVSQAPRIEGADAPAEQEAYSLVGEDRTGRLLVAAVLLGLLALGALRVRGALALIGVALSLLLLAGFLVPAILAGHPPLLVALVGALAVMFVTLVLTNGFGAQTLAGALGISLTLVFTTLVGLLAVRYTGLDGTGSELSTVLAQAEPGLSLEGILLAGMVIGGLGVLADTAVTQASAVMALRRADARLGARALYGHAVVVGRDHLAATIHTLVLAYAGTVLPLLLVLRAGASGTVDTINQTDVAEPILATIVGCAGLIVAVPLTTALAAVLVARIPPDALPEGDGHHH